MKPQYQMKQGSYFGRFLKRLGLGLLKDFFRVGAVFAVVFILIILHLSNIMPLPPLDWILKGGFGASPSSLEAPEPLPKEPQTAPNLLP